MLNITNRRYIGSKRKLVEHIYECASSHMDTDSYTVADLFAGTGAVSEKFITEGKSVIVNDMLFSNVVAYRAWFGKGKFDNDKIKFLLKEFNHVNATGLDDNYFSTIYGNKYFNVSDAKKIGYIRDKIEDLDITEREYFILLSSLMYAADKVANTVGHYEHYLKGGTAKKLLFLEPLKIDTRIRAKSIYCTDANKLAKKITCDVTYIDPPYNARQYVNFYHVLENLARWEKPSEFQGDSMKFKRDHLKSEYSRSKAPLVFQELIQSLDTQLIMVSYNNTFSAKSSASNNKITETQILDTLKKRGEVTTKEIPHKFFNSGKTNFDNHKEMLYICKVKNYDVA